MAPVTSTAKTLFQSSEFQVHDVAGRSGNAAIVNQDVDLAEGLHGLLHQAYQLALRWLRRLKGEDTSRPYRLSSLAVSSSFAMVVAAITTAAPSQTKAFGDGLADTFAAAGNNGYLIFSNISEMLLWL